jgi:hypothetical protein
MKVYVMYDNTGRIRGTAAANVRDARIGLHPGLSCIEEEHDVAPEQIKTHLVEIHKGYTIDVASNPPKRVPLSKTED